MLQPKKTCPSRNTRIVATVLAVIWAGVIFTFSAIPGADYPSHPGFLNVIAHFSEYLIFGVLLTVALSSEKRPLWISALIALVIASLYAASDEFHQLFVPGRDSDPMDWLTDTIGAAVGAIIALLVISNKRVKRSRQRDGE
jgi:VanZ family protein